MSTTVSPSNSAPEFANAFAVRCRGVIKDFGSGQTTMRVLHGIDLDVPFGKQTFIVGPSGCGKTTLVSVIAGLLSATGGDIDLLGTPLKSLRGSRLVDFRARNLGFIFQQFNLLPALSAVENASVPLLVQGFSKRRAEQAARQLLERLGMGPHLKKYPNQLSGGQQQRVAIARSLVHNPRVLICDEPTASLDAETGHAVMEMLKELATAIDRAVIVVTHDNRIYSFADQIAHIADGRITEIETTTR